MKRNPPQHALETGLAIRLPGLRVPMKRERKWFCGSGRIRLSHCSPPNPPDGRKLLFFGMSTSDLSGVPGILTRGDAGRIVRGMWRLVRTLLFALALAGSIGQASASAAPERPGATAAAMAAMPDCAEMMMQAGPEDPPAPCDDAGPDCMGRVACAAVAVPLPSGADFTVLLPAPRRQQIALGRDDTRAGERTAPLRNPPKAPA